MDKSATPRINSGVAHAIRRIVFEEQEIALLQVSNRCNLRPFADGGEPRRAVAADAYPACAEAKVDKTGAVEPLGRAFFRPGVGSAEHRAGDGDESIRAIGGLIAHVLKNGCFRRLRRLRVFAFGNRRGCAAGRGRRRVFGRRWLFGCRRFLGWFSASALAKV